MAEHKFGGDWTEKKLSCLKGYLNAYRKIFTANERARYFKTWYVDAFAGTGTRSTSTGAPNEQALFEDVYEDKETSEYRDGSAKIALALPEPFDGYLFIEKSKGRVSQLKEAIQSDYAALLPRCDFRHGDANDLLKAWCKERDWKKERAVVFLDPYRQRKRKRQPVTFWHRSDEWETPPALFAALDAEFHFTLDVAALPYNAKCERFFTPGADGLRQRWEGVCWCNPPYGLALRQWLRKAHESAGQGATVVCLVPARTDTQWWHDYVLPHAEIRYLRGRLKFNGIGNSATFPSAITVFRPTCS